MIISDLGGWEINKRSLSTWADLEVSSTRIFSEIFSKESGSYWLLPLAPPTPFKCDDMDPALSRLL